MYADFLDDPKLITLAFEDQRHFIGILACKCAGHLDNGASPVILDRIVAQKLWIDYAIIGDIKKRLVAAGLIDESWQPLGWEKRQFKSDHDLTAGERQRRYREKQRNALHNALSNEPVTRTETETDTDTDTDTDKCFTGTNVPVVGEVADMSAEIEKLDDCPQTELLAVFAEELPDLPQPVAWGGNRATNLRTRWKWVLAAQKRKGKPHDKAAGLEFFRRLFGYIAQSNFLMGRAGSWQADLGWIVKAENFAKILQGNYENKEAAA